MALRATGTSSKTSESDRNETSSRSGERSDRVKKKLNLVFKIYEERECPLFELANNSSDHKSFAGVFNLILALGIVLSLYDVATDSLEHGSLYLDVGPFVNVFGVPSDYIFPFYIWLVLIGLYFAIYPMFVIWARLAHFVPLASPIFTILYILYNLISHGIVLHYVFTYDLLFNASCVLALEQIRLTMKSYSFIRENGYKVLYPWKSTDTEGPAVWYKGQMEPEPASFRQFIYFTFCPVLLYRDKYPRSKRLNFGRALWHAMEFVMPLMVCIMIGKNFLREDFELIPMNPSKYVALTTLKFALIGVFALMLATMCIMHGWMNLWAELTRFGDREFYRKWWTCGDFRTYFRDWNVIVHDWIFAYIYQDWKLFFKSKMYLYIAALPPIVISSLVHEYMIGVGTKAFIPSVTFLYCVFGSVMFVVKMNCLPRYFRNLIFLTLLSMGMGLMIYGYVLEYYMRYHCPIEVSFRNAFTIRSWSCYQFLMKQHMDQTL